MTQSTHVIANDTGANVRSAINTALKAIAENNSGSSAPSTTYAYQLWADETNNVLKQRNSGNTAWKIISSLDTDLVLATKTSAYTVLLADMGKLIPCDPTSGSFTVTLPNLGTTEEGFEVTIMKLTTSSNSVTVDGDGSDTINGGTTWVLYSDDEAITLRWTGTEWLVQHRVIHKASSTNLETPVANDNFNKYVTPYEMHRHPGMCKMWVRFNGTGTIAIKDSYNVSSLTDGGVGDYAVNLSSNFSSGNSCVTGMANSDAGVPRVVALDDDTGTSTSAIPVEVYSNHASGTKADSVDVCVVAFGDM